MKAYCEGENTASSLPCCVMLGFLFRQNTHTVNVLLRLHCRHFHFDHSPACREIREITL